MSLLSIRNLAVTFATNGGLVTAVNDVSLDVEPGETVAVVGESGSGKSVTALSVLSLLGKKGNVSRGGITFDGRSLIGIGERDLRQIRGREISIIFQNPMEAMNPIRKVGDQISDALVVHTGLGRAAARAEAIRLMEEVRISRARERFDAYPFQLSGGMCQRIMIAIAISCRPRLLIADEPTTGLDVTTQKVIMDIVRDLCAARQMACMIITHDLALASEYAGRIVVMQGGNVVEAGSVDQVLRHPRADYTSRLIAATPRRGESVYALLPESERMPVDTLAKDLPAPETRPLLEVRNLVKLFPGKKGSADIRAVDDVSFSIGPGESLGLVGESGSGKTTVSRIVARLMDASAGQILFEGQEVGAIGKAAFARSPLRGGIQYVFQDPSSSLNPRWTAFDSIADPLLRIGTSSDRSNMRARVHSLAEQAGLPLKLLSRLPHQLSGGQKARVGIARAIALAPRLLILDEPTTALDVSVQAIVLNQLDKLKRELGFSFLFISHDLTVVSMLCERVIIMRAGKIEEEGAADEIFDAPRTEYVRTLIDSIPQMR